MAATYFKINKEVVHESFDNETIVINLGNGNYYTFNQVATNIWHFIKSGYSFDDVVVATISLYEGSYASIKDSLNEFIERLKQEELLALTKESQNQSESCNNLIKEKSESKLNFVPPTIQKFDDLQQMLFLDAIHEIDVTGWPNKPNEEE